MQHHTIKTTAETQGIVDVRTVRPEPVGEFFETTTAVTL